MSITVHGRTSAPHAEEPHPVTRLLLLATLALIVAVLVGAFAGIVTFIVGLASLAAYAASHDTTQPRRPSASGASERDAPAAARRGTHR